MSTPPSRVYTWTNSDPPPPGGWWSTEPEFPNTNVAKPDASLRLDHLHTEILSNVFGYYADRRLNLSDKGHRALLFTQSAYALDRYNLASLCLVSSRLRAIAQPILYRNFPLGFGDIFNLQYRPERALASFLRTVAERRDLAVLVKSIYINAFLPVNVDVSHAQAVLDQTARGLGIQLSTFSTHFPDMENPSCKLAIVLVNILIAILPNLDHLGVGDIYYIYPFVCPSAVRALGVDRLRLETIDVFSRGLSSVQRHHEIGRSTNVGQILDLTPGIKTLTLDKCNYSSWNLAVGSKLQTLSITHSEIGKHNFEALLSACVDLHTLVYKAAIPTIETFQEYFDGADTFDEHYLQPPDAVEKLEHLSGKLKSLHLDFGGWEFWKYAGIESYEPISSLEQFVALEDLLISENAIYPEHDKFEIVNGEKLPENVQLLAQVLPPTIITLQLCGVSDLANLPLKEGLLCLTDCIAAGKFPKLKQVRCYASAHEKDTGYRDDGEIAIYSARYDGLEGEPYDMKIAFSRVGVDFAYDPKLDLGDDLRLCTRQDFETLLERIGSRA
ncbi:hypothetical protein F4818DRAFT_439700 [Hypoxylon cercidicola]|nr:hypothetical protein F4818DRAFT_439700 [Hypoxylon cercidicola]